MRQTKRRLWRSKALVANAQTFAVTPDYLLTGYGFTAEPDYLYLLDRRTGRVVERLSLPSGPERITRGEELRRAHVRPRARRPPASILRCSRSATAPLGATVWRPPADAVTIGELSRDGPILLLFYLFDWTGT